MGKWIDRAALLSLTAVLFYLLFFSAFDSIFISCCMSFLCCALLHRLHGNEKFRLTKFQARTILEQWAYSSDEAVKTQIAELLHVPSSNLIYLSKHPTAAISVSDVFGIWKKYRNADQITITAVCYADSKAKAFASELQAPSVKIADAHSLIPLIRRSGISPPNHLRGRQFLRHLRILITELPARRPWHRSLLTGLGLMLLYLLTGSAAYLTLSIGSLFIAGVSLRT